MVDTIKEVIKYRDTLFFLTKKNLTAKYKRSFLGFMWSLLNPILMMIVYSLVFSSILIRNVESFPIFLFIGIMSWRVFSTSITTCSMSIVMGSNLVTKIYFPRIILPLSHILVEVINYFLTVPIIIVMILLFSSIPLNWYFLLFIPILFIEVMFVTGLSLIVAAITVFFRDVQHILTIILLMWFYLSGVIYPFDMLSEKIQSILIFNPLVHFILLFRDIFYYSQLPNFSTMLILTGVSLVTLVIGLMVFISFQDKFAEEL